ncbi:LOW QUALITY PROTEIN: leukocyte immunoglobulin-like receptor subfamily A member 6 [Molossus nigricans]
MTPTLTALLCLGLSLGLRTRVQAGTLPKPTLQAEPGSLIPLGSSVNITCQGTLGDEQYRLDKEGNTPPWKTQKPPNPGDKATFSITRTTDHDAGRYCCYYCSPSGESEHSDPLELVVTGSYSKPSLSALPSPVVTSGGNVTLLCQSKYPTNTFLPSKERAADPPRLPSEHQAQQYQAEFSMSPVTSTHGGTYRCYSSLSTAPYLLSQPSELELWVSEGVPKPSIWVDPGPLVTTGSPVTIWCQASLQATAYVLYKERGSEPWDTKTPQNLSNKTGFVSGARATFPVSPVNSSHGGTYRCYGSPRSYPNLWSHSSDPLHLEVTGVHREPSLSAQPGSLVLPGDSLTLQCGSEAGFDGFALTKHQGLTHPQRLDGQHSPDFLLGRVDHTHGGRYRCYSGHSLSYAWSAPSAPLDILVTGMYTKPSLSILPGPSVPWGANVTLQCGSEIWFDTFHLYREGSLDPPQHLPVQKTTAPSQANFTIGPVTSTHRGTYRCYGSRSASPYLLSHPSDLELLDSGLPRHLYVLIGVSVALILLLFLLLFLFFRHQRQGKGRTSDAAMKDPQPGVSVELDSQQNTHYEDPQEVTYTQVNPSRSRPRKGMDTSPSSQSKELLDARGRQAEKDRRMDSQAAASDAPQDVTYAQLNHLALRREEPAPRSSPPEEPPEEPSVYVTLATH